MGKILIVDGYNIIYCWPELRKMAKVSLEEARDNLISVMADYAGFISEKIVIVFDAGMTPDGATLEKLPPNIEVIFSGKNETADQFIERMVFKKEWGEDTEIFVATSDYAEQTMVFGKGAYRISASELREEVKKAKKEAKKIIKNNKGKWRIYSGLDDEVLAKLERMRRIDK
ncbi:NYN domain-containing protein [Thermosyntropha sp.]|uniref:NYN domain-containing protein n=1 Tax=Thermosyntropha sp. TaxID=2740820 RepID=UPI0025ED88F8|nr:NYN domain-containing protein [Thermosyntropha sp.]MBO8158020.1 NYN domain-containing protein [Thermosyntropha sp.]